MQNICLGCGLCCDGTMYRNVSVEQIDNIDLLVASGVNLVEIAGETKFRQPCAAFGAGSCSIYDDRPATCRRYRCRLRRRYDAGEVSFHDARFLIDSVIDLRGRIRPTLERLSESPGPHALADLYELMQAKLDVVKALFSTSRDYADFTLNAGSLTILLSRHFELPRSSAEGVDGRDAAK
jgi:uncharacterized protein